MKKRTIKIIGRIIIGLVLVVLIIIGGLLTYRQIYRTNVLNENKITSESGIDEEMIIDVNGIKQYLYARGQNKENPVILFLHGGPGSPVTPMIYAYQSNLENDFTVVNWDQRNAGKTYFLNEDKKDEVIESLSINQSIDDIYDVVTYLKDKYKQDVIIMGHSWGSAIGAIFANEHPEMIKAYVGIGQDVSLFDGEKLIAEETLKIISEEDKENYLSLVSNGDNLNFASESFDGKKFSEHRSISGKYLMPGVVADSEFIKLTLLSPYYSLSDIRWFLMDNLELQKKLLTELSELDLRERSMEFKVPMIFISGNKDWVTPYPMVEEYYNSIQAPYKKMIFIDNAGHSPMLDNPEKFSEEVIKVLNEI